jgi:2-methylcitrate dehydratase PrpD
MAMRLHHGGHGVKGGNGFWDYLEVDFRDPALLETARKVKVIVAANDKWERVDEGAGIEVETVDGRRLSSSVPFSKGLPENPMSPEEVEEKFRYLVDPVMPEGTSDAIIAAVAGVEKITNIDELVRLLVAPSAPGAQAAAE